jgi:cold shock CspA family protein
MDKDRESSLGVTGSSKTAIRGSVTRILRQLGSGFVLTERGDEAFFGPYALDGIEIDDLAEGQCVEIELWDAEIGRRTIRRIRTSLDRSEKSRCA